jgi:hypothetical protein
MEPSPYQISPKDLGAPVKFRGEYADEALLQPEEALGLHLKPRYRNLALSLQTSE